MFILQPRQRLPGLMKDFQRPDDADQVIVMQPLRRFRVDLGQFGVQDGAAFPLGPGMQLPAQFGVSARRVEQPFGQGPDIQTRTADQKRAFAATVDVLEGRFGQLDIPGRVKRLVRVGDVQQVMPDAQLLPGCRLGGADIHQAINLAGVGRDDFALEPFGKV